MGSYRDVMHAFCAALAAVLFVSANLAAADIQKLEVTETAIVVNGRPARIFQARQPSGVWGLRGTEGERIRVELHNKSSLPVSLHPHGLILPSNQDGVPYVSSEPVPPGGTFSYDFVLQQSGTYFLHSHYGFELQNQLAAPIILDGKQKGVRQEVVMMLSDFTFRDPAGIFRDLQKRQAAEPEKKMEEGGMKMGPGAKKAMDLRDVTYDAYLTNLRTLEDPEVAQVEPGAKILLRIINASSASNFFISLGRLSGRIVAVDGESVEPLADSRFEMAVAQRLDIELDLPDEKEAWPVLAEAEGTKMQTGLILATPGASPPEISFRTSEAAGAVGKDYKQERMLVPANPLPKRAVDKSFPVVLEGTMSGYRWMINGKTWPQSPPFEVRKGERIELVFSNQSGMSHPMHLHGHKFQVTEIDGRPINGAVRDTVLVMPGSTVKVQFDADNPGLWMMHCHILWHEAAGMMGIVTYEGVPKPPFYLQQETFSLPSSLAP